jgi:hypothetical protein
MRSLTGTQLNTEQCCPLGYRPAFGRHVLFWHRVQWPTDSCQTSMNSPSPLATIFSHFVHVIETLHESYFRSSHDNLGIERRQVHICPCVFRFCHVNV